MTVSKALVLRFAVADQSGVRSALWRLWKNKGEDDIYVAPSGITSDGNIAGIAKVSLHKSRRCGFGFTSQYQSAIGGSVDRFVISWERPEGPLDGFAPTVSILIPANFLSARGTPYGKEFSSLRPPKKNGALIIDMLFSRVSPSQLLLLSHQTALAHVTLSTGEHFVVIAGYCDDFNETLFTKSVLPLHERTKKMGHWREPADVPTDQLRGAIARFDSRTKTLRIVDIGHSFSKGLQEPQSAAES